MNSLLVSAAVKGSCEEVTDTDAAPHVIELFTQDMLDFFEFVDTPKPTLEMELAKQMSVDMQDFVESIFKATKSGIGVRLQSHLQDKSQAKARSRGYEVLEMLPGGPANRDGRIKVFDVLIKVDGQNVNNMSQLELIDQLMGAEGTAVSLALTDHWGQVYYVDLIRETMRTAAVGLDC